MGIARPVKSAPWRLSPSDSRKKSRPFYRALSYFMRAAESCRRYSREEFQGRARVRRRRRGSLGLSLPFHRPSLERTVSAPCGDPLCESAGRCVHLNHVGGALKAIRTPGRPRALAREVLRPERSSWTRRAHLPSLFQRRVLAPVLCPCR